jgi:hypothetical protein
MMAPDDAWRLAVHEVAHGLLYRVHGGRVTGLERPIGATGGELAGSCTGICSRDIRLTGGLRRLRHDAMAHMAGVEGERLVCAEVHACESPSDLSRFETTLRQVMATCTHGAPLEVWDRTIRRLVTHVLRRHQGILLEVATHLVAHRQF